MRKVLVSIATVIGLVLSSMLPLQILQSQDRA